MAEVGARGRPLGIEEDVDLAEVPVDLPPGATLVLYTDGGPEARDDTGAQFGENGLVRAPGKVCGRAEPAVGAVAAAVEEQLRDSRYEADDLAVLAVAVPC